MQNFHHVLADSVGELFLLLLGFSGPELHDDMRHGSLLRLRTQWSPSLLAVLLVGDLLHPLDHLAVERFLDGNVRHGGGWGRSVPVLLARREPNHVAWPYLLDWAAPSLDPAAPGCHDERLTERVSVPRRPCARLKRHTGSGRARRCVCLEQGVDAY